MFNHIVFMQFTDAAYAAEIREKLLTLKTRIPEIHECEAGIDEYHSERSFDLVWITRFETEADFQQYAKHPDHLVVLQRIAEIRKNVFAVDYHSDVA